MANAYLDFFSGLSKGRGLRGRSLLPMEGGAPKWRRLDGDGGVKESEGDRLKCVVCESTLSTAGAVPLPQWGRLRYEDAAFLDTTPFPKGKAKRRRLRRFFLEDGILVS